MKLISRSALALTGALTALLAACSPNQSAKAPAATGANGGAKFNTDLPMPELMAHVIDPASFTFWKGAGTEITAKGERSLAPTTEEGWTQLENGAAVLIEAGNMLQLPGRPRAPEADWNRYAQRLTAVAIRAKAAAEKHDEKGVYQTGAEIYQVCTDCHKPYVIDPGIKANGIPKATLPPIPEGFIKKK